MNTNFFLLPTKLSSLPTYLPAQSDLCSTPRGTRLSSVATLSLSTTNIFSNRSFRYASPHLWNQLPVSFRQPSTKHSGDYVTLSNASSTCSSLSPSITHSIISFQAQNSFSTNLFHHSLLVPTWNAFSDYTGQDIFCSTVFMFSYFSSYFGSCGRLSWLNCQLSSAR